MLLPVAPRYQNLLHRAFLNLSYKHFISIRVLQVHVDILQDNNSPPPFSYVGSQRRMGRFVPSFFGHERDRLRANNSQITPEIA